MGAGTPGRRIPDLSPDQKMRELELRSQDGDLDGPFGKEAAGERQQVVSTPVKQKRKPETAETERQRSTPCTVHT